MTLISNARATGFACLLVVVGTLSAHAKVGIEGALPAASAASATILAFNPQPDPPGAPAGDEDGFDRG